MKSKNMYIVATTTRLNDVKIEGVYDADVFTIDDILAGLKKKLNGRDLQISKLGCDAYIDVIDKNNELSQTYSILRQKTFINNNTK